MIWLERFMRYILGVDCCHCLGNGFNHEVYQEQGILVPHRHCGARK